MLYLFAKLLKFSVVNNLFVENNNLLKARALSFRTLMPVGKIGETMTVVFGDNIRICSILCIKSSYVLCTSSRPRHLPTYVTYVELRQNLTGPSTIPTTPKRSIASLDSPGQQRVGIWRTASLIGSISGTDNRTLVS